MAGYTEIEAQPPEFFEDDGLCAVVGCEREGHRRVCPYDGRAHYHGRIHYENDHPRHPDLKFRENGWFGICGPHYDQILAGLGE